MARWRHIYDRYLLQASRGPLLTVATLALLLGVFWPEIAPMGAPADAYSPMSHDSASAAWLVVDLTASRQLRPRAATVLSPGSSLQRDRVVGTPVFVASRGRADLGRDPSSDIVCVPAVRLARTGDEKSKQVAELTATLDCVWSNDAAMGEQASLVVGQAVRLVEGLAEITFTSGAKVILQGPARLEIVSDRTAILHAGRLTADVPDGLVGFKILTPMAEFRAVPADPKAPRSEELSPGKPSTQGSK